MRLLGFLSLFFVLPHLASAQPSNAGIVQGLWYDQDTFFAEKPVRIYVAIRNNTGADLKGAVEFFVNGERIERNFIDALDGRIVESWADWTPPYGTSTVSATLSRTELSSTASGTQAVTVTSALAEDVIFVDLDTDNDMIGNQEDTDDDGDGVSDSDEEAAGTDPLSYDEPASEEEDAETDKDNDTKADESETETENLTDDGDPAGLEQYLTDNRASDALSSVTNFVTNTKKRLDEYRENRSESREEPQEDDAGTGGGEAAAPEAETASSSDETATSTDEVEKAPEVHIGEITRSTEEKSGGFSNVLAGLWSGIAAVIIFIYDTFLLGLSVLLGRPILVQVLLLLLILFLILKLASRFSRREY